jgi:hypothetical protein
LFNAMARADMESASTTAKGLSNTSGVLSNAGARATAAGNLFQNHQKLERGDILRADMDSKRT